MAFEEETKKNANLFNKRKALNKELFYGKLAKPKKKAGGRKSTLTTKPIDFHRSVSPIKRFKRKQID